MSVPAIMKPDKITVHCSATKNGSRYELEQIRADHIARGFRDIGYHLIIQPDGEVQHGRSLNEVGAHVEGHNAGNIGVCLIGTDRFSVKQFDSLDYFIHACQQSYDITPWDLYVHNEWDTAIKQGKTCPNFRSAQLVAWYLTKDLRAVQNVLMIRMV